MTVPREKPGKFDTTECKEEEKSVIAQNKSSGLSVEKGWVGSMEW